VPFVRRFSPAICRFRPPFFSEYSVTYHHLSGFPCPNEAQVSTNRSCTFHTSIASFFSFFCCLETPSTK